MNATPRSEGMRRLGAEACGGCRRTDVEMRMRAVNELGEGVRVAFNAKFIHDTTCDRCWIDFLRERIAVEGGRV